MTVDQLHTSFDARDWARCFKEQAAANPSLVSDEGALIAWFANALMRGHDEHAWRSAPTTDRLDWFGRYGFSLHNSDEREDVNLFTLEWCDSYGNEYTIEDQPLTDVLDAGIAAQIAAEEPQ